MSHKNKKLAAPAMFKPGTVVAWTDQSYCAPNSDGSRKALGVVMQKDSKTSQYLVKMGNERSGTWVWAQHVERF